MQNTFSDFKKISTPKKVSISLLLIMISMINGKAGAKIISGLLKEFYYQRKNKKLADGVNSDKTRVMLLRLANDGLVERERRGFWKIAGKGKLLIEKYLARENDKDKIDRSKTPDLIVVFDVPEKRKKWREWLRGELCFLGFKKVQKSVWLGTRPLPKGLRTELKERRIFSHVHVVGLEGALP